MPSPRFKKLRELSDKIAAQRRWIEEHSGDRAGYMARYGDSGDGWEAIYKADMIKLQALLEQQRLMGGRYDVHGGTD